MSRSGSDTAARGIVRHLGPARGACKRRHIDDPTARWTCSASLPACSYECGRRQRPVHIMGAAGRSCRDGPAGPARRRGTQRQARDTGPTTGAPPWARSLGLLAVPRPRAGSAGRPEPAPEPGRDDVDGLWRRPHSYEHAGNEALHVHRAVGVIDVSTLGKLLVQGPDAARFLELLYPNRFGDMKVGASVTVCSVGRGPHHGRRHDRASRRGPVLRHYHLHRRRHGDRVVRVVERRLGLDVETVNSRARSQP